MQMIKKMKGDDFSTLVEFLDDSSVDSVCECVFNVINTDLRLSGKTRNKLKNI